MKSLDCRGMACPAPVLKTKETIEKDHPNVIKVLVDNAAAKENVSRFLGSQGFKVHFEENGGDFSVIGKQDEGAEVGLSPEVAKESDLKKIMVMIASDTFGQGDDELGSKLMINFIRTLKEMGDSLWRLVFVNNGVKLTAQGSDVLNELGQLEKTGTHILVCGTCLMHFNLMDKKQVGETTNMLDIVTAMQLADKVIHI